MSEQKKKKNITNTPKGSLFNVFIVNIYMYKLILL